MKILVAEDDFTCRLLLQNILARYGEVHVAINGKEAVLAYESAMNTKQPYELICLDIQMPEMDGGEALQKIRDIESSAGTLLGRGVKIIMTTGMKDTDTIMNSFKSQCDAYLVKPIDIDKLIKHLEDFALI